MSNTPFRKKFFYLYVWCGISCFLVFVPFLLWHTIYHLSRLFFAQYQTGIFRSFRQPFGQTMARILIVPSDQYFEHQNDFEGVRQFFEMHKLISNVVGHHIQLDMIVLYTIRSHFFSSTNLVSMSIFRHYNVSSLFYFTNTRIHKFLRHSI